MINSVILPTYNRAHYLRLSLLSLSKQPKNILNCLQVIVVDDGSQEDLSSLMDYFSSYFYEIKYLYIKRDSHSCRARARNYGIKYCIGDIVTFLDAGVVVSSTFFTQLNKLYKCKKEKNPVIYHTIYGLNIQENINLDFFSIKDDIKVIDDFLDSLFFNLDWIDRRSSYFTITNNNLSLLPAPWAIGWTAALSVDRLSLESVDGFDEDFMGWGAEDTDLNFRLYKLGCNFYSAEDSIALHIPHPFDESSEEKFISNMKNERKIHMKNFTFDTELYPVYSGLQYNQALLRYNNMIMNYLVPSYQNCILDKLKSLIYGERTLIVGSDNINIIRKLNITDCFFINIKMMKNIKKKYPSLNVHYLLGYDTNFVDNYYDTCIITDIYRILGKRIISGMLSELKRIAKRVIIIYSKKFNPAICRIDEWPSWNIDDISECLLNMGLRLIELSDIQDIYIYELTK